MFEMFVHYETLYKAESITTNLTVDSQLTEGFVIMKVSARFSLIIDFQYFFWQVLLFTVALLVLLGVQEIDAAKGSLRAGVLSRGGLRRNKGRHYDGGWDGNGDYEPNINFDI